MDGNRFCNSHQGVLKLYFLHLDHVFCLVMSGVSSITNTSFPYKYDAQRKQSLKVNLELEGQRKHVPSVGTHLVLELGQSSGRTGYIWSQFYKKLSRGWIIFHILVDGAFLSIIKLVFPYTTYRLAPRSSIWSWAYVHGPCCLAPCLAL